MLVKIASKQIPPQILGYWNIMLGTSVVFSDDLETHACGSTLEFRTMRVPNLRIFPALMSMWLHS